MPLSRSSTLRTKSRSPAPSIPNLQGDSKTCNTPTGGTQRPFLPPSHYATAGGYLSPEHAISPMRYASGDMDSENIHRGYGGQVGTSPSSPLTNSRNKLDARSDLQTRSPREVTRRKPSEGSDRTQGIHSFTTRSRELIVEHNNGFSNFEPQIVPSLHDNIDRMAGSPQTSIDTSSMSPHVQRKSSRSTFAPTFSTFHDERLRTLQPQSPISTVYPTKQPKDLTSPSLDHVHHRATKPMQAKRRETTNPHQAIQKEDRDMFVSTGSALRLPVKPALKNHDVSSNEARKSPYSRNEVPSQAEPTMSINPLRTVRSLLSRKNSNSMRSPGTPKTPQVVSVKDGSAAILNETTYNSVNATRRKRYAPPHAEPLLNTTTPRQQGQDIALDFGAGPRSSSRSSTSSKSPYRFKSHIPRRTHHLAAHKHDDSSEDQASVSVDDSDLEVRCELERKSARKLMVANGRPDISESGSILDSASTATSGSEIGSGAKHPFSQGHVVEDDLEPNEGTSLDEEISRHLESSLYPSLTLRNDGGVGLGVSVPPAPYHWASPRKQHPNYDELVSNSRRLITQSRPTTVQTRHVPEPLLYSPTIQPLTPSLRPSTSPGHTFSVPQEKTLRFSLPPSDSGISTYSDDAPVLEGEHVMHHSTQIYLDERRSSEESRLDWNRGSNQHQKPGNLSTINGTGLQKSTIRYNLVDDSSGPLSPMTRSSSPRNVLHHAAKYDSCESEYDSGRRDPRRKGSQKGKSTRRRSASVGPRHRSLATEDEEEQAIRKSTGTTIHSRLEKHPPRPMSACQLSRKKHRSDERGEGAKRPASQVFPAHLRDLIRDRTASTQEFNDRCQGQPMLYDEGYDSVTPSEIPSPILPATSTHQPFTYVDRYREISSSAQQTPVSTPRPKFHPPQPDISGKDLRSIAARERLALGIPPSESDEVVHSPSGKQHRAGNRDGDESSSGGLSHAESDMSSLNQSIWQAEEEQRYEEDGHKLLQSITRRVEGERVKVKFRKSDVQSENLTAPRLSIISPTESGSSSCEGLYEQNQTAAGPAPLPLENRFCPNTPQTPYALNSKLKPHALMSTPRNEAAQTREAVIQELFESEETLLQLLSICVNNFILPLRVQNSSAWISGVPSSISKLLDWFDDIVHLHEGVHAGLCAARDMQTAESERVSEVLRECFILRVEVYMPYFMRIDDVLDEVAALVGRQYVNEEGLVANNAGVGVRKSEFGQFILLQERAAECQGWTLDGLLRLPLRRLEAYQNLFAKMLQLTPKSHQDYLSTLSLSRSTDVAMQVMMEVKFREDEYRLLRSFAKRIQAPSPLDRLPTRERRLLYSGPCLLLQPGYLLSSATPSSETTRDQPASNYVSDATIQRSDSVRSANSLRPHEGRRNLSSKSSWLSLLPRRKRNKTKSSVVLAEHSVAASGSLSDPEEISSLEGIPLYAFVFNDLTLLAHAHDNNAENAPWQLLENSGIVKPISISHLQHPKVQAGSLVSMDVIVLDVENINDPADNFSRYSHQQLDLVFPPQPPGSTKEENSASTSLQTALTTCRSTVLKWLSIPKYPNASGGGSASKYSTLTDHALDTEEIVSSLVASGLPLPKSPSGQLVDERTHGTAMQGDENGDEREERGWWSLCYQRSMRELQRNDW